MQYIDLESETPDPLKVIRYEKYVKDDDYSSLILSTTGLLSTEKNRFHKYLGFNKFSKESYPCPPKSDGWIGTYERIFNQYQKKSESRRKHGRQACCQMGFEEYFVRKMDEHRDYVIQHVVDPGAQIFNYSESQDHPIDRLLDKGWKMYKTLDNGGIGFIVMLNNDPEKMEVEIYGRTRKVIPSDNSEISRNCPHKIFDNLIKRYHPVEIFIGESGLNEMTASLTGSGGHGDRLDDPGLSSGQFKYVHVGMNVFEFITDQPIIKYVSSCGNNGVPYPYAESKDWCYCMINNVRTSVNDHPDRETQGDVYETQGISQWSMEPVTFYVAGRNIDEERWEALVDDQYVPTQP
jgi:hypothetical protein